MIERKGPLLLTCNDGGPPNINKPCIPEGGLVVPRTPVAPSTGAAPQKGETKLRPFGVGNT